MIYLEPLVLIILAGACCLPYYIWVSLFSGVIPEKQRLKDKRWLLKNGELDQRFFGAHKYRRTCYSGDFTGLSILKTLLNN